MIKAQGKLMELIVGTIFVVFLFIIIYFYYYSEYNKEINAILKENAYYKAMKTYKLMQSDQLFAISSKDKGFMDKYKLEALQEISEDYGSGGISGVCKYVESVVGAPVYIYIEDLETGDIYTICYHRSERPKGLYYFDLYINIYDAVEDTITIGYVKIGVVS